MDTIEAARRVVALDNRKAELESELDEVKAERARLQEQLIDQMAEKGLQSLNADGRTVYIRREIWASAQDVSELSEFPATAAFVKPSVNGQTLSAYVRELPRDDEDNPIVPEEIKDAVRVSVVHKIGSRKA